MSNQKQEETQVKVKEKDRKGLRFFIWSAYIAALVLIGVHLYLYHQEYLMFVIILFIALAPFLTLLIRASILKEEEPRIFRVPFKDFVTSWVLSLGLITTLSTYWLTQGEKITKEIEQAKVEAIEQVKEEEQKLEDNFRNLQKDLENSNEEYIMPINQLYMLAKNQPKIYLGPVCNVFCAHIRETTSDTANYINNHRTQPSEEIQKIINLLVKPNDDSMIFDKVNKDLQGAYLSGADFQNATLNGVNFSDATLSRANFESAKLYSTRFTDAKLNDSINFNGATLDGVNFRHTIITSAYFKNSKIRKGRFFNTRLTGVYFDDAHIEATDFGQSTMIKVSFRNAVITGVSFKQDSLSKVYFNKAIFSSVDFWTDIKPKQRDVDFTGTKLAEFSIDEITKRDFSLRRTRP